MVHRRYIRSLDDLSPGDAPLVGGETASLGELARLLREGEIQAPPGFAVIAEAYQALQR